MKRDIIVLFVLLLGLTGIFAPDIYGRDNNNVSSNTPYQEQQKDEETPKNMEPQQELNDLDKQKQESTIDDGSKEVQPKQTNQQTIAQQSNQAKINELRSKFVDANKDTKEKEIEIKVVGDRNKHPFLKDVKAYVIFSDEEKSGFGNLGQQILVVNNSGYHLKVQQNLNLKM